MIASTAELNAWQIRSTRIWLWVIVLLGAGLRLYNLDSQSLWSDEGLQYSIASAESFPDVIDRTRFRTWHPPLSFLVNHAFLLAGNSDFLFRLPSALAGIASLPLFYAIMRRLAPARIALFATFVFAMSPFHIWYSQEARMYAQLLFLCLLSSWLFLRALDDGRWWWWLCYSVVVAAGMYTHVLTAFGTLANGLWLLLYHRRHLPWLLASAAIVTLIFLPWMISFRAVRNFITSDRGPRIVAGSAQAGFSSAVLPYTLFSYSAGFSLGPTVAELHENRSVGFILQFWPILLATSVIIGSLLVIGAWTLYMQDRGKCLGFCFLGILLPFLGACLFSLMPRGLFNVRYTILGLPYFCAFIGAALAVCLSKGRLVGSIALLAACSVFGVSLINYFSNPRYAKEDIKSAVGSWRSIARQEPLLSVSSGGVRDAINRYLSGPERDRHAMIGPRNIAPEIRDFFVTRNVSSAYVLLARDWHQRRENEIRSVCPVAEEHIYTGVRLLKILSPSHSKLQVLE